MKNLQNFGVFLNALIKNRSKDLFVARLGTTLLLGRFGITGAWAEFIGYFLRAVIGVFIDEGIYIIDNTLDSIRAAMSISEFKSTAEKEYEKAKRKGLTSAEEEQILKEYLDTLDKFTRLNGRL